MIDNDLIKALRCLASQDSEGDCYREHHNFMHVDGDKPEIYCGSEPKDGRTQCPYHQNKYGVCFEDGECSEWLEAVADELELSAKVYREDEMPEYGQSKERADIDQAIEYFKDEISQMDVFSDIVHFQEKERKSIETALWALQKVQETIQGQQDGSSQCATSHG